MAPALSPLLRCRPGGEERFRPGPLSLPFFAREKACLDGIICTRHAAGQKEDFAGIDMLSCMQETFRRPVPDCVRCGTSGGMRKQEAGFEKRSK